MRRENQGGSEDQSRSRGGDSGDGGGGDCGGGKDETGSKGWGLKIEVKAQVAAEIDRFKTTG